MWKIVWGTGQEGLICDNSERFGTDPTFFSNLGVYKTKMVSNSIRHANLNTNNIKFY